MILLACKGFAQSFSKVKIIDSASGLPISGVEVKTGARLIAISDRDGVAVLNQTPGIYSFTFKFLGYKLLDRKIELPFDKTLVVALVPDVKQLEDIQINTGYQNLPKERATGSFTQLNNKILNQQVGKDILTRLEAVASGLMVDRSTNATGRIMIRGLSTIRGPKSPLVIFDNFPYEGDINNINPNDIQDITILKDAAASSIWGARAGNGVIVITSKKSKFNNPLQVDFNLNTSIADRPDLYKLPQVSAADYIENEVFLFDKGFYNAQINAVTRPVLTPVVEILVARNNGALSAAQAQQQINALKLFDVRDDFLRYKYTNSFNTQGSLNLSAGNEKLAWIASLGYDYGKSDLSALSKRFTNRYQITFRPVANLELSGGINYTRNKNSSGRQGFGSIGFIGNSLYPYARLADENGNALVLQKERRLSYLQAAAGGLLQDWAYYPLTDDRHIVGNSSLNDINLNGGIKYKLPYAFTAEVKYQYENQNFESKNLYDKDSYFARNLVNDFAQYVNNVVVYKVPKGGILDNSRNNLEVHNLRGQLNYNFARGDHQVDAFVGAEGRHAKLSGMSSRLYGYNEENLSFGYVDYTTQFPSIITGASSLIPDGNSINENTTRFVSLFGNAGYTYKGRYTLSASARKDASNNFGVNINNRWNPLWSSGISWNLGSEPFFKVKWVPQLKIRMTYGVSGNIDPSMTAVTTIFYTGTSAYLPEPSARFSNYANPELQWESLGMFNAGLDFVLFNGRISGTVEYYRKNGKKLFGNSLLDYSGGVGPSILKNVASMKGTGYEIQLQSKNIDGDFKWGTDLSLSLYHDKITDYFISNVQGSTLVGNPGSPPISGIIGSPVYSMFGYKWAGLDPVNGDPQGILNNQVTKNYSALTGNSTQLSDLVYFGSALPTAFGLFRNTFSYRRFELNIQLSFKAGYYFRRNSITYNTMFAGLAAHSDFSKRWQNPGDENLTNVPSLVYPNAVARDNFYKGSEVLIDKGDHVRFQYINFNYTFKVPQGLIRSCTIFCIASNLGLIWRANKEGIDPDYGNNLTTVAPGKTFSAGFRMGL
jgi:TonB-linked SusC/RagA family outer membrane protein